MSISPSVGSRLNLVVEPRVTEGLRLALFAAQEAHEEYAELVRSFAQVLYQTGAESGLPLPEDLKPMIEAFLRR